MVVNKGRVPLDNVQVRELVGYGDHGIMDQGDHGIGNHGGHGGKVRLSLAHFLENLNEGQGQLLVWLSYSLSRH